jgi:hypothetical protein
MTSQTQNRISFKLEILLTALLLFSSLHHIYSSHNKHIENIATDCELSENNSTGEYTNPNHRSSILSFNLDKREPFNNFPGQENLKDILLNNLEVFDFNQAQKFLIKYFYYKPVIPEIAHGCSLNYKNACLFIEIYKLGILRI